MPMDRFEISSEISDLLHNSPEPHADWKYLADRMIELGRVHLERENVKLNMMAVVLKKGKSATSGESRMKDDKCSCGNPLDEYAIVDGEKVCIHCVKKLGYI